MRRTRRKATLMLDASNGDRLVSLRGNVAVPLEPLMLALDLEARGFRLETDGADLIIVPFSRLTAEDVDALKRWKRDVVAIVAYAPDDAHLWRG